MKFLFATLAFLVLLPTVRAEEKWNWHDDGNSLLTFCSLEVRLFDGDSLTGAEQVEAGYCVGYVTAVGDVLTTTGEIQKDKGIKLIEPVCVPKSVPTGQVIRVLVKYLKENPEQLHYPADVLTIGALRRAFPCQ